MKEMTAKKYLEAVAKICSFEEAAGRCFQNKKGSTKANCPLAEYACGVPNDKDGIEAVLRIAADYKTPPKGSCLHCGADIRDLRKTQNIKYCPFCGEELEQEGGQQQ